jgi:hypothetical protein
MRVPVNILLLFALVFVCMATASACVAGPIFEEKGTLTVGFHGQYGLLVGDAPSADHFDNGAGYGVRLRYYLGRNRAMGVSLDRQTFSGVASGSLTQRPEEMNVAVMTVDYLWYFDRKSSLTRYITAGAGIHHPSRDYSEYSNNSWVSYSDVGPDGIVLCVGAGLEHFFHRVAALDFSARAYGLFAQGGALGSVEVAVGMNFYIID